jgi:hypothetical protein
VLGVDVEGRPAAALSLLVDSGVHYPSVRDPSRLTQPAVRWVGLPMTLFVDAAGHVTHVECAPLTSQSQLDDLVERHLGVRAAT